MWCIAEIDEEYRERMYDVLDLYSESYDPAHPVVCVDEKPKQLLGEKNKPLPAKPGKPQRVDNEYVRKGSANIFIAVEPKGGHRITQVTRRRTKKDFAHFMKQVVDAHPQAIKIRVVLDNLNTHNETSFTENFTPTEAEQILSRLEFHHTPKHASWLNAAEIEIGVMDTQCTRRRIPDKQKLTDEVQAWTINRNKQKAKINWKFTKEKADQKLGKHYVNKLK